MKKCRVRGLAFGLIILFAADALAQSVLDDSNGKTSIFAPTVGAVTLNAGDSSIQLSHVSLVNDRGRFWAASVKGKSSEGTSLLFQGVLRPGFSASALFGWRLG